MSLYVILGAFLAGVVVTLAVIFGLAYLSMLKERGVREQYAAEQAHREENPLFTCEYHGTNFHDADEARQHAVEHHGAPRDGEAWKATFPEGRE